MSANKTFLGSILLTLVFCGVATAQTATRAQTQGPRRIGARSELHRFLRTLKMTDAQRAVALDEARAAVPIARSARGEAAKIRAQALRDHPGDREAARDEMRGQMKDLRQRTLAQLKPLAQRVLSTLTPEQRTRLAEAARKHGKELDEARLEKITSWLLTRPRLEHRLEHRPSTSGR